MMSGNLIIGAGGHGKVIADIMLCRGMKILGFLDDNSSLIGQQILGLPVLGNIEKWIDFDSDGLVVAVGDNTARRALVQRLEREAAPPWVKVIHPNATIAVLSRLVQEQLSWRVLL